MSQVMLTKVINFKRFLRIINQWKGITTNHFFILFMLRQYCSKICTCQSMIFLELGVCFILNKRSLHDVYANSCYNLICYRFNENFKHNMELSQNNCLPHEQYLQMTKLKWPCPLSLFSISTLPCMHVTELTHFVHQAQ